MSAYTVGSFNFQVAILLHTRCEGSLLVMSQDWTFGSARNDVALGPAPRGRAGAGAVRADPARAAPGSQEYLAFQEFPYI